MTETNSFQETEVLFEHGNTLLAGTLLTPLIDLPYPTVILAHGSGSMNRDSGGYFTALREHFARQSFA